MHPVQAPKSPPPSIEIKIIQCRLGGSEMNLH